MTSPVPLAVLRSCAFVIAAIATTLPSTAQSRPRGSEHWSFQPIRRPELPSTSRAQPVSHPIDRFVLATHERLGQTARPEADRATLIRRLSLDLTGLPPTPDELRAYLADAEPDAYGRLVDRLLASPRYGEHQAHYWLDSARYGDTHGLHLDNYREVWPYRDWVIRAFDDNLPYDRFVVEQLAGDLLPEATLEQQIASGFVRSHVTTSEGGAIEEEVYVRNVIDRVSTFVTVFLGLTIGCAQCHDHKFDPISQREFYGLFAFFNNLDGSPLDGNAKAHEPVVKVPTTEQRERLSQLDRERADVEREAAVALAGIAYEEPAAPTAARVETLWVDDEIPTDAQSHDSASWIDAPVKSGARALLRRGEGVHQTYFDGADRMLRIGAGDELFAHVWVDPATPPRQLMLQWRVDGSDWEHRAYWGESLIPWGVEGTASRHRVGDLPATGRYVRLSVDVAVVGLTPGMLVHGMAFTQHGGSAVFDAAGIVSSEPQEPVDFVWVDDELPAGARAQGDGETWRWITAQDSPAPFAGSRALRRSMGDRLNQDFFEGAASPLVLARGDRLFAHVWLDPKDPPNSVQLHWSDGSWNHRVRFGGEAFGTGMPNGANFRAGDLPATGQWVRIEVALADVGLAPGAKLHGLAFTQVGGTVCWDAAGVRGQAARDDRAAVSLETWLARAGSDESLPAPVRDAAKVAASQRDDAQRRTLREHWLRHVHAGSRAVFAPFDARLAALEASRKQLDDAIPTTLVMRERAQMREAYLLRRGEYDKLGTVVERSVPACLPPLPDALPRDRLGLARWLLLPENPLTARVAVNRFWQQLFGVGLVKTAEDFGTQGEAPSDQALLDWLASEFVASGWDVKALLRTIVSSRTYRQSSAASEADWRADPENRLLTRGPRHRLDAEVLRDQALFLGGLLVETRGGPGVKPPQPEGIWEAVAYVGSNTMSFVADQGPEKVHRRSVYTFWKRTAPAPQMTILDVPSREDCRVRRERTNTPLQALMLLNDTQYVEAARGFAQRLLAHGRFGTGSEGDRGRAREALLWATAREARVEDVEALVALVVAQRTVFAADPEAARKFLTVGEAPLDPETDLVELAAWTIATNVVLNLDETLTKN